MPVSSVCGNAAWGLTDANQPPRWASCPRPLSGYLQKWLSTDPLYGSSWPCYRLPDGRLVEIARFTPGRDGHPVDVADIALLLVGEEVYWTLRIAVFP